MLKRLLKEYEYYLRITKRSAKNTILSYNTDLTEYIEFIEKNAKQGKTQTRGRG